MNSVNLQSEGFERAASNLEYQLERFNQNGAIEVCAAMAMFSTAMESFERSVTRFQRIQAMLVANQERLDQGYSIAYDEAAILNA